MTEQEEDEFMDFGKVDNSEMSKEIDVLREIADNSDMTKEEYDRQMERIILKYKNKGL